MPGPTEFGHIPVMRDECIAVLADAVTAATEPVVIDATCGLGGHSEAMLTAWPSARVLGIDRDPQALALASKRLARFGDRFVPCPGEFELLPDFLDAAGHVYATAILMDLGVSSLQIDEPDRGFSYSVNSPLDMRMNPADTQSAADVVNHASEAELTRILAEFGEERFARRIAAEMVRRRQEVPFTTTAQLVDVVYAKIPAAKRATGGHPAKRTFQALRIAVNDELGLLRRTLPLAAQRLDVGGRLAVLSFHSLEDRIVKQFMRAQCAGSTPVDLPVELPEHAAQFRDLTRSGQVPTEVERTTNPRSTSVRLRAIARIAAAPSRRTP